MGGMATDATKTRQELDQSGEEGREAFCSTRAEGSRLGRVADTVCQVPD